MLAPRTTPPVRRRIVTLDLEWYPEDYSFRLGGVYDGDVYESFDSVADLLNYVTRPEYRGAYIYAHALGLADASFLLREIVKSRTHSVEGAFAGSAAILLELRDSNRHKWLLVDSLWTLRTKLCMIGDSVGLAKLGGDYRCPGFPSCGHKSKLDKRCGHVHSDCIFYAPLPILREYNERDCVVLHRAMSRLQDEILDLGGSLRPTAAGIALDTFLRTDLTRPIRTNTRINEIARRAYHASNVVVLRRSAPAGAGNYDINSSFPYSLTFDIPGDYLGSERFWDEDDELALVDARVVVPEHLAIPPLPYRAKRDGRVYHPVGAWREWFFGVDLQALLRLGGRVEKVYGVKRFERRSDTRSYVQRFYGLRRDERDPFRRDLLKLLMNSLYGKFSERSEKHKLLVYPDQGRIPAGAEALLEGVYVVPEEKFVRHAHVPISGVVTARSRQLLGDALREAQALGEAMTSRPPGPPGALLVWYADTDSIVCWADMGDSKELGRLKRVTTLSREGVYVRPKLYLQDDEVKAKGFSGLGVEDFRRLLKGDKHAIRRMARVRELLREGAIEPHDVEVLKGLQSIRPKRREEHDGEVTTPWLVEECEERYRGA